MGIPKRNQHLYDNSAPTRSDTDKGTDADISYGTECAEGIREVLAWRLESNGRTILL